MTRDNPMNPEDIVNQPQCGAVPKSEPADDCSHQGYLLKWTNYLYGWQMRYVKLKNGTLIYSVERDNIELRFNGVISLSKCRIKTHSRDELRFEISCGDSEYYFRAKSIEERTLWVQKLKNEVSHSFNRILHSHANSFSSMGSFSSLSNGQSFISTKSQHIAEMLEQMSKMKESLFEQIDSLQHSYDLIMDFIRNTEGDSFVEEFDNKMLMDDDSDLPKSGSLVNSGHLVNATKNETKILPGYIAKRPLGHRYTRSTSQFQTKLKCFDTDSSSSDLLKLLMRKHCHVSNDISQFRTTSVGLMSCLSSCLEYIEQTDKQWKEDIEKEREINKKLHQRIQDLNKKQEKNAKLSGPDAFDVSTLNPELDEIFYDAICNEIAMEEEMEAVTTAIGEKVVENPYKQNIDDFEGEMVKFLTILPQNDSSWIRIYNSPPTFLFKKEMLVEDIVMDPYRAIHLSQKSSAKEIARCFWDVKYRLQIDSHVENFCVKAEYGSNMVIVHQIHKTIWPVLKRESLFISKLNEVNDEEIISNLSGLFNQNYKESSGYEAIGKSWMVSNLSVDFPGAPVNSNRVRVDARIGFIAQSFIKKGSDKNNRENWVTLISYSATINPGGWLPVNAVREVGKREIPKFLKSLSNVAYSHNSALPPDF